VTDQGEQTPRETALTEVEKHRAAAARWQAEQAAAEAELEDLQRRAGEEVLADESAAARLPGQMQALRDRLDIATRAVAAAEPQLHEACVAVLLAEAVEWDAELGRRQALLDEHDGRRAKLLKALEDFTGQAWAVKDPMDTPATSRGPVTTMPAPTRHPLAEAVETAERTAFVLREVAAGRDPHPKLTEMVGVFRPPDVRMYYTPTTWGPDAVIPAPAYQRSAAQGTVDVPHPEPLGAEPAWPARGVDTWSGKPL
jgi:hypothetical protein